MEKLVFLIDRWQKPVHFAWLHVQMFKQSMNHDPVLPCTSGHMLVLPRRAVATLDALTTDEHLELWSTVRDAVAAIGEAYSPDGMNIGLNLGRAAGAGIDGHLHVHVLPRWSGDTNFTTTTAGTRVLPEALDETWRRLRGAWPDAV